MNGLAGRSSLAEPTDADFSGAGMGMLIRTNPNALAADGDPQNQTLTTVSPAAAGLQNSPLVWAGIALVLLIGVKAFEERKTDEHLSDVKIGIRNLVVLVIMVEIGKHLLLGATGLAVKANIPYSTQASRFLAL